MTKEVLIEDQLAYVRRRLMETPACDWQRLATDASVAHRTLYFMKGADFDPRYSTVLRLYIVLKKAERLGKKNSKEK